MLSEENPLMVSRSGAASDDLRMDDGFVLLADCRCMFGGRTEDGGAIAQTNNCPAVEAAPCDRDPAPMDLPSGGGLRPF